MTETTRPGTDWQLEPIDTLDLGARIRPRDEAHVVRLAEVVDRCPPILVDRGSRRVIDGCMRVEAAQMRGWSHIGVVWFDGTSAERLEAAVAANAAHGLPLSSSARCAAALSLLEAAPRWSNGKIARASGLSESTVRRLRAASGCPGPSATGLDTRVGADGRAYPVNTAGREAAAALLSAEPSLSDREVARRTKMSPTTAGRIRTESVTAPAGAQTARGSDPRAAQTGGRFRALLRRWLHRLFLPWR